MDYCTRVFKGNPGPGIRKNLSPLPSYMDNIKISVALQKIWVCSLCIDLDTAWTTEHIYSYSYKI